MRTRNKLYVALALALIAVSGAVAETAPAPAPIYPYGYVNPFDPNWWLATLNNLAKVYTVPAHGYAAPAAAAQSSTAPATGSAYVPVQTPYGPIQVFNYADPMAWNKLFAQPFVVPGPGEARK